MVNKLKKFLSIETTFEKKSFLWGWILIAPTLIGLLFLNIIPLFQTLIMSFQEVAPFSDNIWVGFDNYLRLLFEDGSFWTSLGNTFKYSLFQVPITIILAIFLAILLNEKIKGVDIYRTVYFLPMLVSPVATAMVWKWLFNSKYGMINSVLSFLGFGGSIKWLSNPDVVIWAVIIVGIWSNVGYNMVLLLAGLQEIPETLYEAARLDGASKFDQFINVTFPLLTPQIFFVMINSIIGALQVFDTVYIMFETNSSAYKHVETVAAKFFEESFTLNNKGYGSAIITVLLIIIMIITFIQLKFEDKWVFYNE